MARISNYNPETATRLATVMGLGIYENPCFGDEAPVLVKIQGKLWETDFWEVPEMQELLDFITDEDLC